MSQPDAQATDRRRQQATRLKQTVVNLLEDTGLQIRELGCGLTITNPTDPEKGHIHVAFADGYVCWERVTWDYWGTLEGCEPQRDTSTRYTDDAPDEPLVTRQQILAALGRSTPPTAT